MPLLASPSHTPRETVIYITSPLKIYIYTETIYRCEYSFCYKMCKIVYVFPSPSSWSNLMSEKFAARVPGWMLSLAEVQTTDALYTNESIHFNNRSPIWH